MKKDWNYPRTVRAVLIAARELLVSKGWTRDALVRDQWGDAGDLVSVLDPRAVSYSSIGAIMRASERPLSDLAEQAEQALATAVGVESLWTWERGCSGVDEVLAGFDRAIGACR